MTTTNTADDPSAHSVAILLLRDRARMRRVRRLTPDRRLDLAVVLRLVGSSSSQKVVLRSQNESSIRIPPIAVSPSDIDRTNAEHPAPAISGDGSAPPGRRGQERSGRTGHSRRNGTHEEY